MKNIFENILAKLRFPIGKLSTEITKSDSRFSEAGSYIIDNKCLAIIGEVHPKVTRYFDIKQAVCFADVDAALLYDTMYKEQVVFKPLPLYPAVKRDLALVVDSSVSYKALEDIAYKYGSKLLKKVTLFDVYEGDKIANGKKSYAINFVLQHSEKTLTDEAINKVMNKLIDAFAKEAGAQLR